MTQSVGVRSRRTPTPVWRLAVVVTGLLPIAKGPEGNSTINGVCGCSKWRPARFVKPIDAIALRTSLARPRTTKSRSYD